MLCRSLLQCGIILILAQVKEINEKLRGALVSIRRSKVLRLSYRLKSEHLRDARMEPTYKDSPTRWTSIHQMCSEETCKDASIKYHTTCVKCFATYNSSFKDADDFRGRFNAMIVLNFSPSVQRLVAVIQHPQLDGGDVLEADDEEVKKL